MNSAPPGLMRFATTEKKRCRSGIQPRTPIVIVTRSKLRAKMLIDVVNVRTDELDIQVRRLRQFTTLIDESLCPLEPYTPCRAHVLDRQELAAIVATDLRDILALDTDGVEALCLDRVETGKSGGSELLEQTCLILSAMDGSRILPRRQVG